MTRSGLGNRAIVIGSGIAGLAATGALAGRFDDVILVERDQPPGGPAARRGVPQGRHFHALLPGGALALEGLFPGFTGRLAEAGSPPAQMGDFTFSMPQGRSFLPTHYQPVCPKVELGAFFQTRWLLEHVLRRQVESLPGVSVRSGTTVRDPLANGGAILGVVLDGREVACELVVDATGRASLTERWMRRLGYEPASASVVNCDLAYSSTTFEPADTDALPGRGFIVTFSGTRPHPRRGAAIARMEDGTWLCTLTGRFDDDAPTTHAGFSAYARSLPDPRVAELLQTARPLTEPARYRYLQSVKLHYERLDRFPSGLLPIGDAVCHFNPIYGQGMSSAACQAAALGQLLDRRSVDGAGLAGIASEWFALAHEHTRAPWLLAAAADFRDPRTTGDFPAEEATALEMLLFLAEASSIDAEAEQLFTDLVFLRKPLSSALQPRWLEALAHSQGRRAAG